MFSSAPERERDKWGARFDSPPSTSAAAASQANATGRKRKANFSNDETETLVWNVVRHFGALYGSESFRAHPVRRKQLWTQIQSRVNFLGYTERSIDDLKHKWRDLRLDVKKKITAKKPLPLHRPGPPHKPRLTPLEKMVASTFLQPTHDSEPEIVLDPEIFFPGASKQSFPPTQPGTSHPGIYIDTNGQPSSLPAMEGSAVPRLAGQSPDPSMICDYSKGEGQSSSGNAESGPERRTPEMSTVSPPPPLRNESLVSYTSLSEEEERDPPEADGGTGQESQLSAEEDGRPSGRQAFLFRRCDSQGSVTSLPEDSLHPMDAHSDWGHEGTSDISTLGQAGGLTQREEEEGEEEEADDGSAEMGSFPRVLRGPSWENRDEERQRSRSPLHFGALTEESLPSSESPPVDRVPPPQPLPRKTAYSRLREGRRETWRTNLHCLMDMEDQWDQLYHQELAGWQEERAQQREERAHDRELQFQLLGILTDIRDELRILRQERAASRQERASQTGASATAPATTASPAQPEVAATGTLAQPGPFLPLKSEEGPSGPLPVSAGRGDAAAARSAGGVPRRGRGRPRGSTSKHRRLFLANS